jgi:hypothetical protein
VTKAPDGVIYGGVIARTKSPAALSLVLRLRS